MAFTISFDGAYDVAGQDDFKNKLATAEMQRDVIVDLTNVSYVDSSCIAALLLFNRGRRERGLPPETIFAAAGPVAKVLEVTGVTKVCRVVFM